MKATKLLQSALVGVFLLLAALARADEPLTAELIDRWMESQQAMTKWGEENADKMQDLEHDGIPQNVSEFIKPLKTSGLYSEAENMLEDYGFDTPEEWAGVSLRIMHAVTALQMEAQAVNYDIQAQIDQLKNDPNIPQEQKEMMMQMMQQGMQMVERAKNAPPADVEAIRPQLAKIMKFFEDMGE